MLLVYNAKIWCKDNLQAILIENEKIIEINNSEVLLNKYKNVKLYNANGKRVIPGLNDSHLHLIGYAQLKKQLRLENARSITDVIALGKEYLKNNPSSKIIVGNLYNDNNFEEKRALEKTDLDKISKDIPIVFYRVCGHICSVNSRAIEVLKIDKNTFVEGGALDINNGELTGVIRENAMQVLDPLFDKEYTVEDYKELILEGISDANKVGLTSLQPNDISGSEEADKIYQAYSILAKEGKLNARINHQITFGNVEDLDEFLSKVKFENDYLKIGPLKLFIDGSLGARTAAVEENYLNDNQNGILCLTIVQFSEFLNYAKTKSMPVIVHAIGDRGIRLVLEGFEKVNKGANEDRNGIVHVQITSKELLQKFAELNICALVQPIFINTDMFMVYERVSKELADTSYAFKTLYHTTKTSFSSDAPVEDFNPFLGIYHAVTRKDLSQKHTYIEKEGVNVEEAIYAYTENGAYMSFEENKKGKIEVGQYADLIVIDKDIYDINPLEIKNIKVECTIVGGKIVYEK